MKKLDTFGGNHIRDVIAKAVLVARECGDSVEFDFNGRTYAVFPDDSYETAKTRAEGLLGGPILTAEEESARAAAELERSIRESAASIAAAGVPTEAQLREAEVPWLKRPDELMAYLATLVDRPHDYGTCVYAMSMAAVAAFQYVAGVVGATGFQASCADLDILKRTRHMKGPFLIIDAHDMLYPQYDLRQKVEDFLVESRPWAAAEATKELATAGPFTHPNVRAHWESLLRES